MSAASIIGLVLLLLALMYWRQALVLLWALLCVIWIPLSVAVLVIFSFVDLFCQQFRRKT